MRTSLKRWVFARHCHPWSAWSRWASTPLVLVPIWTRNWRHGALVAAWMAVNPVLFGRPAHTRAWASRAMLGEEKWAGERPRDAAMAVNVAATVSWVAAALSARRHRLVPAAGTTAIQMALTLVYWELMVRYFDRDRLLGRNGYSERRNVRAIGTAVFEPTPPPSTRRAKAMSPR
ncbi:MAG: DUF6653 family protein [Streptosporangiales bacterium]